MDGASITLMELKNCYDLELTTAGKVVKKKRPFNSMPLSMKVPTAIFIFYTQVLAVQGYVPPVLPQSKKESNFYRHHKHYGSTNYNLPTLWICLAQQLSET